MEPALDRLLRRQHGVLTRAQAVQHRMRRGASDHAGQYRGLYRIHPRVYSLAPPPLDGLAVHRTSTLEAADIRRVDQLPVTSIERTVTDLAAVQPARQTLSLVAELLRSGRTRDSWREAWRVLWRWMRCTGSSGPRAGPNQWPNSSHDTTAASSPGSTSAGPRRPTSTWQPSSETRPAMAGQVLEPERSWCFRSFSQAALHANQEVGDGLGGGVGDGDGDTGGAPQMTWGSGRYRVENRSRRTSRPP